MPGQNGAARYPSANAVIGKRAVTRGHTAVHVPSAMAFATDGDKESRQFGTRIDQSRASCPTVYHADRIPLETVFDTVTFPTGTFTLRYSHHDVWREGA